MRQKRTKRCTDQGQTTQTQWLVMMFILLLMDLVLAKSRLVVAGLSWVVLLQDWGCLSLAPGCEWVQVGPKFSWSGPNIEWAGCVLTVDHESKPGQVKTHSKFKVSAAVTPADTPLAEASHLAQPNLSGVGSLLPHHRKGKRVNMCRTDGHKEGFQDISGRGC